MEKKVHLWIALIVGIPLIRMIEAYSVGLFLTGFTWSSLFMHAGLGLVMGVACALTAQMLKLSNRQCLWVLPLLGIGYTLVLLLATYRPVVFKMDPTFLSNILLMELSTWLIAIAGAAFIGYVAAKPTPKKVLAPARYRQY
jgi:hypothetical protein